jgi:hypothetical protein
MNTKVTIECDARFEQGLRRTLALMEEMEQLALAAPNGQVFDVCEEAVVERGRKLQAEMLSEAVVRRVEAAEKKGPRSASASAVARRKIGGRKNADC